MILAQRIANFPTFVWILVGIVHLALAVFLLFQRLDGRHPPSLRSLGLFYPVFLLLLIFIHFRCTVQIVVVGASPFVATAAYSRACIWGRDASRRAAKSFSFRRLRRAFTRF